MRGIAMLATLGVIAIWTTSAEAGVVCHERCGYYGCRQICRTHYDTFGPFWAYAGYGWPYHYRYTDVRRGWTTSPY